jgi:RimJ/RimL family protein N-acetyltransferase
MSIKLLRKSLDDFNEFLLANPALCAMSIPDQGLDYLHNTGRWNLRDGSKFMAIYQNNVLCGYFRYTFYTEISLDVHMYVKIEHQGKKLVKRLMPILKKYFAKHEPHVTKIVSMTPSVCHIVIVALNAYGFKLEGHLTKCLKWRNELVDMLIFTLNVDEVK